MNDEPDKPLPAELQPVLPRDPEAELPGDLPRGADIAPDLDPFAEGILMKHQVDWLADASRLKIAEKGRRTGITFAEALDDTLEAAKEGGSNVFYIGDTKDKGREFIGYVAHFARVVAQELVKIEEFLFEDKREDGRSSFISAFRIVFASGKRVEALSSRPENIRGLQGIVVIDEAAFHRDVRAVLDAVMALLIWGGKIRVISTHNGVLNPFNELIHEALAGKNAFKVHHIPFRKAIDNGLFKRVCAKTGEIWSAEAEQAWEAEIRKAYGPRESAMKQELDCVAAESEGASLSRIQIESCMVPCPIARLSLPDSFKDKPPAMRKLEAHAWFVAKVKPALDRLNVSRPHVYGYDFARSGAISAMKIFEIGTDLKRRCKLLLEFRNVPFDQQRELLFLVVDRLPRFSGGANDATGNGQYLAEVARQKYGELIHEVKFSAEWYRLNATPYIEAFNDQTIEIPRDDDVLKDHQALANVNGVTKVPDDHIAKGADGMDRHGDTAIAGMLGYFASRQDIAAYGWTAVPAVNGDVRKGDEDIFERDVRISSGIGSMRGAYG
ncbi:hypothetical protein [Taklimakanibacter albus]|uniref:Uncharacterized protein n=1 Tax=Taklimakanibacter albus TaxID=2800327 RepID=A0ACC5R6Y7_9HYPH|nr:hypothetical protein [Aestuariivirga sp. YIM B02566]MBK1868266.1 hypothetical protein [Aestuariivirga sp. YIM B02566]